MDTELLLRKPDYRAHVLIGKFGQVRKSEEILQKHMRRKTDKQDPKSAFIHCFLSNHAKYIQAGFR